MAHYKPEDEASSERLVMIVLEARDHNDKTFRHLRASIVRRAVSHVVTQHPATDTRDAYETTIYNDDKKATGYRNATWSGSKKNSLYVNNMFLRGQMSKLSPAEMENNSEMLAIRGPYGNEIAFQPYQVKHTDAMNMANTFKNFEKQYESYLKQGIEFDQTFEGQCIRLAIMLNIKTFLFHDEYRANPNCNLTDPAYYTETDFQGMKHRIFQLIKKASETMVFEQY